MQGTRRQYRSQHNKPTYFTVLELRFAVREEEHDVGAALRLARGRREVFEESEGLAQRLLKISSSAFDGGHGKVRKTDDG